MLSPVEITGVFYFFMATVAKCHESVSVKIIFVTWNWETNGLLVTHGWKHQLGRDNIG